MSVISGGMNKFHSEFYNETNQKNVSINGYSVLYVNWLEKRLRSAQQQIAEAEKTPTNKTKVQICPKCKKGNLEMFDSNEDWCPKCKQTFPGKL